MERNSRNIYQRARATAGFTQRRWAEELGVTEESVRLYESGRGLPSDDVAAAMAEIAGLPVLGYWHLKEKSGLANDMLPELETVELPQAVISLLCEIRDFKNQSDELLTIAADGMVSSDERGVFEEILTALDGIVRAALMVKYARTEGRDGDDRP